MSVRERYAALGVDVDGALRKLAAIQVSIHCWQGDDVGGFETPGAILGGGGIQATGCHPGKARSIDELRAHFLKALRFIPGRHRLNLHASYLDNGGVFVDRDAIEPKHFQSWIDWAKLHDLGLDFNPTYFSHAKAADGFTLSHQNADIRNFWIEHGIRCREIASEMGRQLGSPCVTNIWIPDGYKDIPVDRRGPRERFAESLDQILAKPREFVLDALESKLFGIGVESYTVGSAEFCQGYAASRQILLTLDAGHFHPTESIAEKISALLLFVPALLLHVSRPVRWDSDHVVLLDDELRSIAQEIIRSGENERIHIGLDYFDASIDRVAAWVIGTRNLLKALLIALLEPTDKLRELEQQGDFTRRLLLLEEMKSMPWGEVWLEYCESRGVPGLEHLLAD